MLRVPIEQAHAGMVLARSVPNPQQLEHTLLKANYEVLEDDIKRLRSLRVHTLWVQYPGLDFLDDLLDPELVRRQQELYGALKEEFGEQQGLGLAKVDYSRYVKQMQALFARILAVGPCGSLVSELQGEAEDIYSHCTRVATLAILVGLRLEGHLVRKRPWVPARQATDLTLLGVGCLLHDIGKLQLPEELRNFHLTAHDRGRPLWQSHTEVGFEMIEGGLDPMAGQVVINHHQNFDGGGFPARKEVPDSQATIRPLRGDEIHIFCRIASIADRFDGFRYLPDGRVAPTVVALHRLRKTGYTKWFDPVVYEAFLAATPAFNPGEQVILNDGQNAVVTEVNDNQPCRPIVRPVDMALANGHAGKTAPKEAENMDINLVLRNDLFIARVGAFDVTEYLH